MDRHVHIALFRFRDRWLIFRRPMAVLTASSCADVPDVLEAAASATRSGRWAAGWVAYEAAPAFDPALMVRSVDGRRRLPLVWFGIYNRPVEASVPPQPSGRFQAGPWRPATSRARYIRAVCAIRELLAAGDTYQVNYTTRLRTGFRGDPYAFFLRLVAGQMSDQCAFILTDTRAVCSASPELFIELEGARLMSRPMKGTAPRGLTWQQDVEHAASLRLSEKNRAENVMIVDMIRNDMGRVAEPGTVKVARLFDIERYRTVLQMTSTVECRTRAPVPEIFKAMFPCASVTGAPKVKTMQIISELETSARGIYTGSVGFMAPGRMARFNVAIRTAVVDLVGGRAEYGVGGGIVWDSDAEEEYRECLIKARVLHASTAPGTPEPPRFELLETILWRPGRGYYLLESHLRRMRDSALYFQMTFSAEKARLSLKRAASRWRRRARRVRLLLDAAGRLRVESAVLSQPQHGPWRLAPAAEPVNAADVFLYHKTTNRGVYERAARGRPGFDDVVLYNERGEITETTIGNIVAELNGRLLTPPVRCGLLAGVYRGHLIRKGIIGEEALTLEDLKRARKLWVINSVRKWMPAELAG